MVPNLTALIGYLLVVPCASWNPRNKTDPEFCLSEDFSLQKFFLAFLEETIRRNADAFFEGADENRVLGFLDRLIHGDIEKM